MQNLYIIHASFAWNNSWTLFLELASGPFNTLKSYGFIFTVLLHRASFIYQIEPLQILFVNLNTYIFPLKAAIFTNHGLHLHALLEANHISFHILHTSLPSQSHLISLLRFPLPPFWTWSLCSKEKCPFLIIHAHSINYHFFQFINTLMHNWLKKILTYLKD